jgi:hypothetical protein
MSTPEQIAFMQALSDDDKLRFSTIQSTMVGACLSGCDTCFFASYVTKLLPEEVDFGQSQNLRKVSHYAIELNDLSREASLHDNITQTAQDRLNEERLFLLMMQLGLPEEEFDVVCAAFKHCLGCESELKVSGRFRSIEETKTILEAELATRTEET